MNYARLARKALIAMVLSGGMAWLGLWLFSFTPRDWRLSRLPEMRLWIVVDSTEYRLEVPRVMLPGSTTLQEANPRAPALRFFDTVRANYPDLHVAIRGFNGSWQPLKREDLLAPPKSDKHDGPLIDAVHDGDHHTGGRKPPQPLVIAWLNRPVGPLAMPALVAQEKSGGIIAAFGTPACSLEELRAISILPNYVRVGAGDEFVKTSDQALAALDEWLPKQRAIFEKQRMGSWSGELLATILSLSLGMLGLSFALRRDLTSVLGLVVGAATTFLGASFVLAASSRPLMGAVFGGFFGFATLWRSVSWTAAGKMFAMAAIAAIAGCATASMLPGFWQPLTVMITSVAVVVASSVTTTSWIEIDGERHSLGGKPLTVGGPGSEVVWPGLTSVIAEIHPTSDGVKIIDPATQSESILAFGETGRIGRKKIKVGGRQKATATTPPKSGAPSFSLLIHGTQTPLVAGAKLAAESIFGKGGPPVAEVTRNPNQPELMGLTNLSDKDWLVTLPNGSKATVGPSKTVKLAAGTKIAFGGRIGEIVES